MKFKPAACIDSISCKDPSLSRKAVAGVAKSMLMRTDADERHQNVFQLPSQGEMTRAWGDNSTELWVKASQSLPQEVLKFVLIPLSIPFQQMPTYTCRVKRPSMVALFARGFNKHYPTFSRAPEGQ